MKSVLHAACILWGMEGAECTLIAERENKVFKVTKDDRSIALRLHRKGYRSNQELTSELLWMDAVSQQGLSLPTPVPSIEGEFLHVVGGVQIDALNWLNGETLDIALPNLDSFGRNNLFRKFGQQMAKLHRACDAWASPKEFTRIHWNKEGLLGSSPVWDRFWDNPELTEKQRDMCLSFREHAWEKLSDIEDKLDYGLIHADLVPANVMFDGSSIHLIDFDDGGYGFRLFEIATALLKLIGVEDFEVLQKSLLEGYLSARDIDTEELSLFFALRAATYVGWNISRIDEHGGRKRNARFIQTFLDLAFSFLKN